MFWKCLLKDFEDQKTQVYMQVPTYIYVYILLYITKRVNMQISI